jgi:hypothetical protein
MSTKEERVYAQFLGTAPSGMRLLSYPFAGIESQALIQQREKAAQVSLSDEQAQDLAKLLARWYKKAPANSAGTLVGLAQSGLDPDVNADSPGVATVLQLDSMIQAEQDLAKSNPKPGSIASNARLAVDKPDESFWEQKWLDPVKAFTRNAMLAMSLPFDGINQSLRGAVGAAQHGDLGEAFRQSVGLIPGLGAIGVGALEAAGAYNTPNPYERTTAGMSIVEQFGGADGKWGGVDQGTGWVWVDDKFVRKHEALSNVGVNPITFENGDPDQGWTVGRALTSLFTESADSAIYRLGSGLVDATLAIALDPMTYVPGGFIGKIARAATGTGMKVTAELAREAASARTLAVAGELDDGTRALLADAKAAGIDPATAQSAAATANRQAEGLAAEQARREADRIALQEDLRATQAANQQRLEQEAADLYPWADHTPEGYTRHQEEMEAWKQRRDILTTRKKTSQARLEEAKAKPVDPAAQQEALPPIIEGWGHEFGLEEVDAMLGDLGSASVKIDGVPEWAGASTFSDDTGRWLPAVTADGEVALRPAAKTEASGEEIWETAKIGKPRSQHILDPGFLERSESQPGDILDVAYGKWISGEPMNANEMRALADELNAQGSLETDPNYLAGMDPADRRATKAEGTPKVQWAERLRAKADELSAEPTAAVVETGTAGLRAVEAADEIPRAEAGRLADLWAGTIRGTSTETEEAFLDLLATGGVTYGHLLDYAVHHGLTPRLAETLQRHGKFDAIDNAGAALGVETAHDLRWVATEAIETVGLDPTAQASIARKAIAGTAEELKALRARRQELVARDSEWKNAINDQRAWVRTRNKALQEDLAHADEVNALLDRLAEAGGDLAEIEPIKAALLKLGERSAALGKAFEAEMGLRNDPATMLKYLHDPQKFVDYFTKSRKGRLVVDRIINIDDVGKMAMLLGNKLDGPDAGVIYRALTAAKTPEEVAAVLMGRIGAEFDGTQNVWKGVPLTGGNSLRVIPKGARRLARRMTAYLPSGRMLDLNDAPQLSREIQNYGRAVGMDDNEIADMIRPFFSDDANALSNRDATFNALEMIHDKFVSKISPKMDPDKADELRGLAKEATKIFRKDMEGATRYLNQKIADGADVGTFYIGKTGEKIRLPDAFTDAEFTDGIVFLPDMRDISRRVSTAGKLMGANTKAGKNVVDILDYLYTDLWRTAMLAFRPAYIFRNQMEMAVRMFLSGSQASWGHPLSHLALALGSRERSAPVEAFRKSIDRFNGSFEMGLDGTVLRQPKDADSLIYDWHEGFNAVMRVAMSTNDQRLGKLAVQAGLVTDVTIKSKRVFNNAWAQNLLVRRSGKIDQIVVGVGPKSLHEWREAALGPIPKQGWLLTDPAYQRATITWLHEHPEGMALLDEIGKQSEEMAAILRDSQGAKSYLFGARSDSVLSAIRLLTANFDPVLLKFFRYGKFDDMGLLKGYDIRSEANALVREREVARRLRKINIPAEDKDKFQLPYRLSKFDIEANVVGGLFSRGADWFFSVAAKVERAGSFGPEFQAKYAEHLRDIAPLLDAEALAALAKKSESMGRTTAFGRQLARAVKSAKGDGPLTLADAEHLASQKAGRHVRELFYHAQDRRQMWHTARLAFPFGQAWANSIGTWMTLAAQNPQQAYKAGKALNALQSEESDAIYALPGFGGDDRPEDPELGDGGFLFRDPTQMSNEMVFRYPAALTSVAGALPFVPDVTENMDLVANAKSLDFAFGQGVPLPGVGPMVQMGADVYGLETKAGPVADIMRKWTTPYGTPGSEEGLIEYAMPNWMEGMIGAIRGNTRTYRQQVPGAAAYVLGSSGRGLENIADPAVRERVSAEVDLVARLTGFFRALGQATLPASPSAEWKFQAKDGSDAYIREIARDYRQMEATVGRDDATVLFMEKYSPEALVATMGITKGDAPLSTPAWNFYKNDRKTAEAIGLDTLGVMFFGDASVDAMAWQKERGARRDMTMEEMRDGWVALAFQAAEATIKQRRSDEGMSEEQYEREIDDLEADFGGRPSILIDPNRVKRQEAGLRRALRMPEVRSMSHYPFMAAAVQAYDDHLAAYREAKGDPKLTLTGKGAAGYRASLMEELRQIENESRRGLGPLDPSASGVVALIESLIKPKES